ncbi:mannosylglycerate hydrolase [uncultured Ilyobacter sp.]|uniref:mannosylglycerate hydrolase n=1 Tax=uncultured Ilyobacter sp. TaxID=544433 RepID=UPI0029C85839|nr:mannosylglycerate hydrolase [uncultured Ilyobacter sp.]
MKKYKVHVVPHMHWDREWYFTTEESRILLLNNMEEILDRLETDPEYKYYVLDGQTAILEDYFAIKPENKDRIKALVQSGKLIIGPWYSQTDSIVVNGESITRNLLYGIKDCKEFGSHMSIGYIPDSFGQSEQLPQIFNGFNIDKSMFWRGCSERHGTDKTEFYWESLDGSKVLNQIMPLGYAIGKYLPTDKAGLKKRLDTYLKVLEHGATGEALILPNGHDQMPLQKDIFEVMDTLNEMYPDHEFFMSNFDNVYDDILKNKEELDTIRGEFIDGKYMRIHRSISSTRMDIKDIHAKLEYRITNVLEPLAAVASTLGFEYHHGLIEHIWKLIMKNHAHDSIGCCCSDKVHREILERFILASDKVESLIIHYKRKIADHSPAKDGADKLVVYNLLPNRVERVVDATVRIRANDFSLKDYNGNDVKYNVISKKEIDPGLIDRQIVHYGVYEPFMEYEIQFEATVPAMGYETLYISKVDGENSAIKPSVKEDLENEFYTVTFNKNGTINVLDKELGREYKNLLLLEEGSDDGDEYDYSPLRPKEEMIITNEGIEADIEIVSLGLEEKAVIKYRLDLPQNLEDRKKKIINSYNDFEVEVSLKKGQKRVDIKVTIDNNVSDHRVRMHLPTPYESSVSVADQQFGSIERSVHDTAMEVWEKENWKEMPVSIYSMMSLVGLHNSEEGLSVLTNGLREYEIIGEGYDTLAITLMRGIGVLGKEELYYRPGRPSGIKLPTPDSQMLGKQTYEFSIYTHKGSTLDGETFKAAKDYTTSYDVYNKIPYDAMKLNLEDVKTPVNYSLFEAEGKAGLSVVKISEDNEYLVVRIFNPYRDREIDEILVFNRELKEVKTGNLNEEVIGDISYQENRVKIEKLKPCEARTILFKL